MGISRNPAACIVVTNDSRNASPMEVCNAWSAMVELEPSINTCTCAPRPPCRLRVKSGGICSPT